MCLSSCIYKPLWFRLEAHLWGLWWDVMGCDFHTYEVLCGAAAALLVTWVRLHPVQMTSLSSCCSILLQRSTPECFKHMSWAAYFSSFLLRYYTLVLQRSRPTPPYGCSVGVDCAVCFIFIPLWGIFCCLYSALVLQSVPSAVRVALITQEKPGTALTV